ncbi:MAG: hypothetical protein HPY66_3430 [Firmicutes bacterium]|nr:hypothetical protein [Bacillota bacterium]MDI6705415.1 hypothetical protein [Bacillota bacterium]
MRINNDRGSALVMVMMFTLILTILGTAMLGVAINEYMMEKAHRNSVKAYYLAEAGMEKAIYEITDLESIEGSIDIGDIWEMESEDEDLVDSGIAGNFTVTVDDISLTGTVYVDELETEVYKYIYEIILTAEGQVDGAAKRLEAKIEVEDYVEDIENKVHVIYWKQTS